MTEDAIATRARALAGALTEAGFARLRVRDGDTEIELRRAPRPNGLAAAVPAPPAAAAEPEEKPVEHREDIIASDVVGILRHVRPPIAEGQDLDTDRELASVETLGIRNPVRSRGGGRVVAVFVTEGQPVEYGQPLFAIER
ncbi:MAG: acetyl-CoA carboxylase biotin carboxyl carrier protein [Candidatus Eremiobacteraeota bacterium]|jgi:acetyl-CoA carboxylase biotin carboxyl carrier protein|nr:acetyl-CoA carboxylase biotin carboxyl carrier protein [Candidatus Eremiobacteraeota bacterium]